MASGLVRATHVHLESCLSPGHVAHVGVWGGAEAV